MVRIHSPRPFIPPVFIDGSGLLDGISKRPPLWESRECAKGGAASAGSPGATVWE